MDNQFQVIAKQPPLNLKFYNSWNSAKHFHREKYAYDSVLPAFERFQRILPNVMDGFHSYPFMYQACVQEQHKEFVLLNDLRGNKFETMFQTRLRWVPFTYDQSARVLVELAKFHAISFSMKQSKANHSEFQELTKQLTEITFGTSANKILQTLAVESMKVFIEHSGLSEVADKDLVLKIRTFAANFIDIMRQVTKPDENAAIVHGDCWISNILFRTMVIHFYF